MKLPRLALRALNDYRRLSPFTYLGLRYSLLAAASQDDGWATEIAPDVLRRQAVPAYLPARQYKQVVGKRKLEYRDFSIPGGNQALAEAALLSACSAAGGPFAPTEDVFSYHLASPSSLDGCFKPYFKLFMARHRAIAKACRRWPEGLVLYADIKKFYPSVTQHQAVKVWREACNATGLDPDWREIGELLLEGQRSLKQGLLIGPMFSHVIGNLLLVDFDKVMRRRFRERYFRYVDDVALVIPPESKDSSVHFLREQLKPLRLELNPDKLFPMSAQEWLSSAPYQAVEYGEEDKTDDKWWMHFVDGLKCYLMVNPDRYQELVGAFRDGEIRISLPRYRAGVEDARYAERFARRLASTRFRRLAANLTTQRLLNEAEVLRKVYGQQFQLCWEQFQNAEHLERKWVGSRLRYLLGRLMLLAHESELGRLAERLAGVPEFAEYQACFHSLATRDVSELVRFSGKVCAAAGQALATMRRPVRCEPKRWSDEAIEGYVTLALVDLDLIAIPPRWVSNDERVRFAFGDFGYDAWVRTKSPFFQELFALAGTSTLQRHRELLDAPLDPDERWVLFADELRGPSS